MGQSRTAREMMLRVSAEGVDPDLIGPDLIGPDLIGPDLIGPDLIGPPLERPPHQTPKLIALVVLGGAVGAPLRYLLTRAIPTAHDSWPTDTFITNISGALVLGFLLEFLLRTGPDSGVRRGLRILLGTGVLGAFTTYSTLVTETDLLIRDGCYGLAAGYCLASVGVGILAALVGIGLARVIPMKHPA